MIITVRTLKIYDNEPYKYAFTADVLSCERCDEGYTVVLDKTAFFHEGGGQKCDTGKIGDAAVTYVYEKAGAVYHVCDKSVCGKVLCEIDGGARFMRMQHHTAEHIVCGIIHRYFGYDNVGFHLNDEGVTLDINGKLTRDELDFVERLANEAVFKNSDVHVFYPDEDELVLLDYRSKKEIEDRVRIVEIEGVDMCACCAPHVAHTGDIGVIKLLDAMNYKGGMRIFMLAGSLALADYSKRYKDTYDISVLLSAKQEEIVDAVKALKAEINTLKGEISEKKKALCSIIIDNARRTEGDKVMFTHSLDGGSMRNIVNACASEREMCALFSANKDNDYDYIISGGGINLRDMAQDINKTFDARGGGNDKMIQGNIRACEWEIRDYFAKRTDKSDN